MIKKILTDYIKRDRGIPRFVCANCGYQSHAFHLAVHDIHSGAFSYMAACPECGSRMVNPLPGFYEHDQRISVE